MSIGVYKGHFYKRARLCDMLHGCKLVQKWWFTGGNHYKTLKQLQAAIDIQEQRPMTAIKIQYYANNKHLLSTDPLFLFPTEGCHINGTGKVAGLFRTIEDAKAGDGHEEAIVLWVNLTLEEQAVATANSEWLANQSN